MHPKSVRTRWGSSQRSHTTAGFKGSISKGREEENGGKGRGESREEEGKERRKGRD